MPVHHSTHPALISGITGLLTRGVPLEDHSLSGRARDSDDSGLNLPSPVNPPRSHWVAQTITNSSTLIQRGKERVSISVGAMGNVALVFECRYSRIGSRSLISATPVASHRVAEIPCREATARIGFAGVAFGAASMELADCQTTNMEHASLFAYDSLS
jgi:hypothetical protein